MNASSSEQRKPLVFLSGNGHVFALAKRGWDQWNKKGELGARVCHYDFFRIRGHFVFFRVSSTLRFIVRSSFPLMRCFV